MGIYFLKLDIKYLSLITSIKKIHNTKSDKIKRSQKAKLIKDIKNTLNVVEGTPVIPFSAIDKSGRDEIWEYIDMAYENFKVELKEE